MLGKLVFAAILMMSCTAAAAQKVGLSEEPESIADEDPGTIFKWEVELAPAIGDNPKIEGFRPVEDNAFSGAIGLRHNFPSGTYVSGTLSAEVNPEFLTAQVPGAEAGGEVRFGQRLLLGGAGDPDANRDFVDFHLLGKLSHGSEEKNDVSRSYTDREVGVEAAFSNILWLYLTPGERDRSKFRPGPAYDVTLSWASVASDRDDRDNRALSATAGLGYTTRRGLGLKGSVKFEDVRYRKVDVAGAALRDRTYTAYAGFLFTKVPVVEGLEIGGEFQRTNSNDDSRDDTAAYLRLKISFANRRLLGR